MKAIGDEELLFFVINGFRDIVQMLNATKYNERQRVSKNAQKR